MRSEDGYGAPEERYSPECAEGSFSEVRWSLDAEDAPDFAVYYHRL